MNYSQIPPGALAKLLAIDDAASVLTRKSVAIAAQIEDKRKRLGGRITDQRDDPKQLSEDIHALLADQKALERRVIAEQRVLSNCKLFLDELPANTTLEQVTTDPAGHDLGEVRARIKALRDEIKTIEAAPVPSPDVRQRIAAHIAGLGAPSVSGVGAGQQIRVVWPGALETRSGRDERSCDLLAMLTLLFPEKLVDAAMAAVERDANYPVPVAKRPAALAALQRELDEAARIEEALIEAAIASGAPAHRDYDAEPAAVLGVRVVEKDVRKNAA